MVLFSGRFAPVPPIRETPAGFPKTLPAKNAGIKRTLVVMPCGDGASQYYIIG